MIEYCEPLEYYYPESAWSGWCCVGCALYFVVTCVGLWQLFRVIML